MDHVCESSLNLRCLAGSKRSSRSPAFTTGQEYVSSIDAPGCLFLNSNGGSGLDLRTAGDAHSAISAKHR